MRIAFNPSTVAALTSPPNNKDITFDLRGQNIFARGVEFKGTDTNTWRPVVDNLTSNSATSSLSANQGRVLAGLINGKSNSDHNHDGRYLKLTGGTLTGNLIGTSAMFSGRFYGNGDDEGIIIKPSSNGFAGLILGTHDGERSIFYFVKNKPFWRYSHGSDNLDIIHPKKSGTIALISDIPNKNSWNYDDRYLKLTGGTMLLGEGLKFHANDNYFGTNADARIISLLDNNDKICDGGLIIDERATLNGKEYVTELLRIRDSEFKWRGANILHSGNYSNILDSRYYTESEVNNLLSTKLDRVKLTTGSWNPRGYNLAADYHYNGGNLSISESKGQIHVSINGYFWQNEGRSRVLDTSDVAGLKGNLTVHQYLSNTDTTWQPLIWGGNSHANTSDSTGAVHKSYNVLSWQTSSQTLYATRLRTTFIDLENNRGISRVTSGGTSPFKGIQLPDLQSNGVGIFSKVGEGYGADEGGVIISADTSVIYNSFNTGWGLTIRDKDKGQMNISEDVTIAFGIRRDYRAYSLGGFEKAGSSNSYVLLGGGGHKLESALSVANADMVDGYHANGGNVAPYGHIPTIESDGVMEVGKYIDFHNDNSGKYDFSTRLQTTGNYGNSVYLPSASGTLALTSQASSFDVNTAQYLRSLGNRNCQTGRTQAYGDVYSYNTYNNNTGSPTEYTSVIGFGRGTGGTVEIAGGWCNTNLYWRSLRDCYENWYSWRTVLDSNNYTDFIGSYYWANVKISTTSSTTTSPTVSNLTATSSIRMSNILLEHTDEINNTTNDGSLNLNCRNSGNVSLCAGGGKVGIGTRYPPHELYVMGYTHTKGFGISPYYLSDSGLLPTISPGDGYTYRCLEIGRPTKISCIIADKTYLPGSTRGVLLNFKEGFDGQLVLLKDLQSYGSGNGYFWVMPSRCKIIRADDSGSLIDQNQISGIYDDGRSRFFIYSSKYRVWIEFLCSNTI